MPAEQRPHAALSTGGLRAGSRLQARAALLPASTFHPLGALSGLLAAEVLGQRERYDDQVQVRELM